MSNHPDWDDEMAGKMQGRSKYYVPFVTACCAGVRPEELKKRVLVELVSLPEIDEPVLRFSVRGAKVTSNRGQEWRRIIRKVTSPMLRRMRDVLDSQGVTRLVVDVKNKGSFRDCVRHFGSRTFPRKTDRITPYCCRMQYAGDLKKDEFSKVEIAVGMGHRSDKSQRPYKAPRTGRRGTGFLKMEAPSPVRQHANTDSYKSILTQKSQASATRDRPGRRKKPKRR